MSDEVVLDGFGQAVGAVSTAYTVSIIMAIVAPIVGLSVVIGLVVYCVKAGRCCGQTPDPDYKCCPCGGGGEEAGMEGEQLVGGVNESVTANARQNVIRVDNFFNHT